VTRVSSCVTAEVSIMYWTNVLPIKGAQWKSLLTYLCVRYYSYFTCYVVVPDCFSRHCVPDLYVIFSMMTFSYGQSTNATSSALVVTRPDGYAGYVSAEKPLPRLLASVNSSVRVLLPDDGRSLQLISAPVISLCYIAADDSFYWLDPTRRLVAANVATNGTVFQVLKPYSGGDDVTM